MNYYLGRIYNNTNSDNLSTVASNPTRMCICNNSTPDCNVLKHHLAVYPGEMFEIEAVAVGQRMGVVPSTVIANLRDESLLCKGQDVQSVGRVCTTLQYKVHSLRTSEVIALRVLDIGVPKVNATLERILPSKYRFIFFSNKFPLLLH